MDILQAFGIQEFFPHPGYCLALVGSGGKTTTMFKLARCALGRGVKAVWITTTTHLSVNELHNADHVYFIRNEQDWQNLSTCQLAGIILVCGPEIHNNRVAGLPEPELERLYYYVTTRNEPLFVEADGSRGRPLKAPASHEPAIPSFVQAVVVVVGLSGLGKPLTEEFVHRPELFAALSGQHLEDRITPSSLSKVLTHPLGGLKHIPPGVTRLLLFNQADSLANLDEMEEIVNQAQHVFTRIVVAATGTEGESIQAMYQPIAGIILAAGSASRFGAPKQILLWRGKPLVQHVMQAALAGGLTPIRIVIGAHKSELLAVLEPIAEIMSGKIEVIFNPDWAEGMSTSIRVGLSGLSKDTGGAVFLLADQPHIPSKVIHLLRQTLAKAQAWAVAPIFKGRRANPVLFGRELFPQLAALHGDMGGRELLQKWAPYPIAWVPWEFDNLEWDIDKPEDYQHLLEMDET